MLLARRSGGAQQMSLTVGKQWGVLPDRQFLKPLKLAGFNGLHLLGLLEG